MKKEVKFIHQIRTNVMIYNEAVLKLPANKIKWTPVLKPLNWVCKKLGIYWQELVEKIDVVAIDQESFFDKIRTMLDFYEERYMLRPQQLTIFIGAEDYANLMKTGTAVDIIDFWMERELWFREPGDKEPNFYEIKDSICICPNLNGMIVLPTRKFDRHNLQEMLDKH